MWLATLLLLAAGAPPPDRLEALLAEARGAEVLPLYCLKKVGGIAGGGSADSVALEYQGTSRLPSVVAARALLAALIEHELRPSRPSGEALRHAVVASRT